MLLVFFKVSCPVCQMTLPYLERLHAPGALRIYGISQNDAEETAEFNRRFGISLPMLLDPENEDFPASNAYGISSVPTMFWIEADGKVGRVIEGWQKKQIEWLAEKAGVIAIPHRRKSSRLESRLRVPELGSRREPPGMRAVLTATRRTIEPSANSLRLRVSASKLKASSC